VLVLLSFICEVQITAYKFIIASVILTNRRRQ